MINFLIELQTSIQTNPLVLGLFGSTIIGVVVYALREYPKKLYFFILDSLTTTITVIQDDNHTAYYSFEHELNTKKWYYLTGRFHLVYRWLDKTIKVGCGENSVFLTRMAGKWCIVSKHTDSNVSFWHHFYYKVRFFTRNQKYLDKFFKDVYRRQNSLSEGNTLKVYQWIEGGWDYVEKKKVDMPLSVAPEKEQILKKIAYFLNYRKKYEEFGRPYKEGFILSGDPGCGKSYFILQVASVYDLNIFYVNLRSFATDNEFIKAIMQVSFPSIILIEDIDCNEAVMSRKPDKREQIKEVLSKKDETEQPKGISLSTILNIFDGLLSQDGQITFITTNHIDKLDPALVRAGRFNTNVVFKPLAYEEICEYMSLIYKEKVSLPIELKGLKLTISEISSLCDNRSAREVVSELLSLNGESNA